MRRATWRWSGEGMGETTRTRGEKNKEIVDLRVRCRLPSGMYGSCRMQGGDYEFGIMKIRSIAALFVLLFLGVVARGEEVKVSDLTFAKPEGWKTVKVSSPMRKAQFGVGEEGEVVFFHFGPGGAGGKDANVARWFRGFKEGKDEINAKTEEAKAGEIVVTFVSASGTYLSGMPGQKKEEKPGYALLGAIVEAEAGAIFVKFTGKKETVDGAAKAFKAMVTGAK